MKKLANSSRFTADRFISFWTYIFYLKNIMFERFPINGKGKGDSLCLIFVQLYTNFLKIQSY
ncbi:MAG: hypothetical protein PWQ70_2048 [Clostridiales bacterium]|jgi:hypothetical protein|nr:hypothetical protein [Clostridiales bacterium]